MDQKPDSRPGASAESKRDDQSMQVADNTIDQLRFLAVDDLLILMHLANDQLSVTAVAEKLSLTQPAITQRIRKMEEAFAQKIIERRGRGIQLTTFGLVQAKRATAAIEALKTQSKPQPTSQITPDKIEMTSPPEH